MTFAEIPQAAGITGILTAAGLDERQVHEWFHRRRVELTGLTPALVLITIVGPHAGRRVLALAQADALELRDTGEIEITALPKHAWEGSC
jgi:hypothetical protein